MRRIHPLVLSGLLLGTALVPQVQAEGSVGGSSRRLGTSDAHTALGQVDWPMFRFDNMRSNVNPFETILNTSNVHNLRLAWSQPIGFGNVSGENPTPVVSGGSAFGSSFDGIAAFDIVTGQMQWRRKARAESSPSVADGVFYVGGSDRSFNYGLGAVDATTGGLLWSFPASWLVRASPAVLDGVVYVRVGDGFIYAMDASAGQPIWKQQVSERNQLETSSSPALAGGLVYLSAGGGIEVLDASDGSTVWTATCGVASSSESPTIVDGVVYVGLYGPSFEGILCAFDADSGELLWTFDPDQLGIPDATVHDGRAYLVADGVITALDIASGTILWTRDNGLPVFGPPALANGVLYAGGYQMVAGFDASTGDTLWTATIPGGDYAPTPAVAGGRVFVSMEDATLNIFALP